MGLVVLQRLYLEKVRASHRMDCALALSLGSVRFDLPPLLKELIAYLSCGR